MFKRLLFVNVIVSPIEKLKVVPLTCEMFLLGTVL